MPMYLSYCNWHVLICISHLKGGLFFTTLFGMPVVECLVVRCCSNIFLPLTTLAAPPPNDTLPICIPCCFYASEVEAMLLRIVCRIDFLLSRLFGSLLELPFANSCISLLLAGFETNDASLLVSSSASLLSS